MLLRRSTSQSTKSMGAEGMKHPVGGPSRRKFISISAASAVMALAGPGHAAARRFTWRGVALGAEAEIQLFHASEIEARRILHECVTEIDRLENIFSLYRRNSTLCRLNRLGRVSAPEMELVDLLATALQVSRETNGAFDITVQPLWELYRSGQPQSAGFDRGTSPCWF